MLQTVLNVIVLISTIAVNAFVFITTYLSYKRGGGGDTNNTIQQGVKNGNIINQTVIIHEEHQNTTVNTSSASDSSGNLAGLLALILMAVAGALYSRFKAEIALAALGTEITCLFIFWRQLKKRRKQNTASLILVFISYFVDAVSTIFFWIEPRYVVDNEIMNVLNMPFVYKILGVLFCFLAMMCPPIIFHRKGELKTGTAIGILIISIASITFTTELIAVITSSL